jgi:hypothetical protein
MSDQERPEVHLATGDLSYPSTDEAFHHTRLWLDAARARGESQVTVQYELGEDIDGAPQWHVSAVSRKLPARS